MLSDPPLTSDMFYESERRRVAGSLREFPDPPYALSDNRQACRFLFRRRLETEKSLAGV